jgi:hypothetical protein
VGGRPERPRHAGAYWRVARGPPATMRTTPAWAQLPAALPSSTGERHGHFPTMSAIVGGEGSGAVGPDPTLAVHALGTRREYRAATNLAVLLACVGRYGGRFRACLLLPKVQKMEGCRRLDSGPIAPANCSGSCVMKEGIGEYYFVMSEGT